MSKRIAILSKYPPLEGGIAARTYWMARGFASAGHEVDVITHGIDTGREYRIQNGESSAPEIPNLHVHRPQTEIPWHLPEDDEQTLALLDLTIEVIREHNVQVLDSGYLVPYGLIGHLAKLSTGVTHVMRHGGSDIERFLKKGILGTILDEATASANTVITEERHRHLFEGRASHLVYQPPYVPDSTIFTPNDDARPRFRLASIGKINYHWQHKGLHHITEIMRQLTGRFECLVVGQGKGLNDFQNSLDSDTVNGLNWRPFLPPWQMPNLLNELDGVFIFESGLPHPVFSNLAVEALCSGVGIITDRADFAETYRGLVSIGENQVLVVSQSEPSTAAERITQWVQERADQMLNSRQLVSYQEYISLNEGIYRDLLNSP